VIIFKKTTMKELYAPVISSTDPINNECSIATNLFECWTWIWVKFYFIFVTDFLSVLKMFLLFLDFTQHILAFIYRCFGTEQIKQPQ
jgi:hypothetical protein